MRTAIVAALALVLDAAQAPADPVATVKSPDGNVEIGFSLGANGAPLYSVSYGGKPIVADSALGLTLRGSPPLTSGLKVVETKRASRDELYTLVAGKTREGRDRCEELTVVLEREGTPSRLELVFRAYDDGAAFRYVIPRQEGLTGIEVVSEDTRFRFLEDHRAWALFLASFTTANEREFVPVPLLAIKPESIVGPPLTIEMGGGLTVALAEANLKAWSGLHLARVEGGNDSRYPTLVTKLAPLPSRPDVCVRTSLPAASPWRVLMIGARPGDLIESTLIYSLADPSAIGDTSWIRPGKVAWDWWNGPVVPGAAFQVGMNNETFRHFIDFASEFGLEYMLIDAGWYGSHQDGTAEITRSIPEMDIPGLVAYAKERKVGILLWLNWETVRDQMEEAFALYEKWGVQGVKVDYMNRKDQEIVAFYHRTLRTAARHHLAVDFHGAYAPTGEERTWPNLLTREGVMGMEYAKWSDRVSPRHNVTIPFTRMLAGPMDYTPGAFRNVTREAFAPRDLAPMSMGTRAHQLAMYVVYDSPLQMVSDNPDSYRGQPGAELLKVVPASWDETRVLDGKIGEYVVIARRLGDEWFIGAMTDAARTISVPLAFLGTGTFEGTVYSDVTESATEPTRIGIMPTKVAGPAAKRTLALSLVGGGGAAIHLRPATR